jgi:adenylate kinase family enzyme
MMRPILLLWFCMDRIIVIGLAGAGKTTLAKRLSELLDVPHTELDSIFYKENWEPVETGLFKSKVAEIAKADKWILCGNYFSKLGLDLWRQADTIIWCDYSFPRVAMRLFRRTVRRMVVREELWSGNRESFYTNFLTKDSIFVWSFKSRKKQSQRYGSLFSSPGELPELRLIRLKTPKATESLLNGLKHEQKS